MGKIMKEDEKALDSIVDSLHLQILDEADNLLDDVEEQFNVPARTFPIADFEAIFLPMLTDDLSDEQFEKLYNGWIIVAGDVISPVGLCDTNGNILTVIPGLRTTEGIAESDHGDESLSKATSQIELESRNLPHLAEGKFANKLIEFKNKSKKVSPGHQWYNFLKYFNMLPDDSTGDSLTVKEGDIDRDEWF
jgi:hypothetical protein